MTKLNSTEVVVVLDRSGSMSSIRKDMEGGFDSFMEDQKKLPGECLVTLAQFDNEYDIVYQGKPVNEVPNLVLEPRGGTALLGAVGRTIDAVGSRLRATPESDRPERVLFIIITDGQENASYTHEWSRQYNSGKIKEMIEHQTSKYQWSFVYLGANQDAVLNGQAMGIKQNFTYQASSIGTRNLMKGVSEGTRRYRSGGHYTP